MTVGILWSHIRLPEKWQNNFFKSLNEKDYYPCIFFPECPFKWRSIVGLSWLLFVVGYLLFFMVCILISAHFVAQFTTKYMNHLKLNYVAVTFVSVESVLSCMHQKYPNTILVHHENFRCWTHLVIPLKWLSPIFQCCPNHNIPYNNRRVCFGKVNYITWEFQILLFPFMTLHHCVMMPPMLFHSVLS